MFQTETLRHRETARTIVELMRNESTIDTQIIDFSNIEFASRSFLHELLSSLSNRKIIYRNLNKEVKCMMEIAKRGVIHPIIA